MDYRPLILIGAPRSGTNMLRDVLTRFDGVATWPCDEINYIWRHGNARQDTDELSSSLATHRVAKYIRNQFDWVSRFYHAHIVVEKTCANSLRVPFVDKVLPEAKYIFIYRNGLDVVGSALKRWNAALDIPYLVSKARFVPLSDLPYYAYRYFWNRAYRMISQERRLAFWGPRFTGLEELLAKLSLPEVCALQWQRCVELSETAFIEMPTQKVSRISYETFVTNPATEVRRISDELGLELEQEAVENAIKGVNTSSIGKGREMLDSDTIVAVTSLIGSTLQQYGYDT